MDIRLPKPFKTEHAIEDKICFLNYIEKHKINPSAAAKVFCNQGWRISDRTARKWRSKEISYRAKYNDMTSSKKSNAKRLDNAGRKCVLSQEIEHELYEWIMYQRMQLQQKVSIEAIIVKAKQLATANNIKNFGGSRSWQIGFFNRFDLSLRRVTNKCVYSKEQLVERAVVYLIYLKTKVGTIKKENIRMHDETAVYFEDMGTTTVDITGSRHVPVKTTPYSTMRVTAMLGCDGNGNPSKPFIIGKNKTIGKGYEQIEKVGNSYYCENKKAWMNEFVMIKWIDLEFPPSPFDNTFIKAIVVDSCRAHVSKKVKAHCKKRNIELVIIGGGLTPYLQVCDVVLFSPYKKILNRHIKNWIYGDTDKDYGPRGGLRPPRKELVTSWVICIYLG